MAKPRRDKIVSFMQLGRLATPTVSTATMPSLREILAKTSSCTSELGDPTTTPQPRQSVAQWLRNIHTPDSIDSGVTPLHLRKAEASLDMGVQTSQSISMDNIDYKDKDSEEKHEVRQQVEKE